MLINIPISFGELIDKITILQLKLKMIDDKNKLSYIRLERDKLLLIYEKNKNFLDDETIRVLYTLENTLYEINKKLWYIEDDIRVKEKNKRFDESFVELARSVYKTNDNRMEIKNKINKLMDSDIKEQKSYKPY